MKILHVITSLRTGGAEKLMVDLLPRLRDRGLDVELCLFDGADTPFKKAVADSGITMHELGKNRSVYHPANLLKLLRLIRRGGYDIVHTHNTAPQLFAAVASCFAPGAYVTTEHNTTNRRRSMKGFSLVDRRMYNRYDRVICISRKAEENLREYLGDCKAEICTINNGIDVGGYADAEASRKLEEIAPGSRKIMMVAGFREQKDQDTLIRALNFLPEEFHLFLVGDGERRSELEALAKTENLASRVHFLGVCTDVPELLHAADYVVMSSHYEGLSLSSVEGMSVGKPFLASDVDGLREVVEGAGILFAHGDALGLADAIAALEQSPERYEAVARACRERANQFDISTMADGYAAIYKSL